MIILFCKCLGAVMNLGSYDDSRNKIKNKSFMNLKGYSKVAQI